MVQTYDDGINRAESCDANVIRIRSTHGRQGRCDDDLQPQTAIDQHGGELIATFGLRFAMAYAIVYTNIWCSAAIKLEVDMVVGVEAAS